MFYKQNESSGIIDLGYSRTMHGKSKFNEGKEKEFKVRKNI